VTGRRGRPRLCSDDVVRRVVAMRKKGLTLRRSATRSMPSEYRPLLEVHAGGAPTCRGYCIRAVRVNFPRMAESVRPSCASSAAQEAANPQ
jgi:hypothetical protein